MIAEGGTERGHAISMVWGPAPDSPFEGDPANPVLSARSTSRAVQNTGHGDLVAGPDGQWYVVVLGCVPRCGRGSSALWGGRRSCSGPGGVTGGWRSIWWSWLRSRRGLA